MIRNKLCAEKTLHTLLRKNLPTVSVTVGTEKGYGWKIKICKSNSSFPLIIEVRKLTHFLMPLQNFPLTTWTSSEKLPD